MFLRSLGHVAVMLSLTACVAQKFTPQDSDHFLPAPESWRPMPELAADGGRVCHTLGGDPLARLQRRLIADNLELRGAIARLRQAEAVARRARSPLLPRLDVSISGDRGDALGFATLQTPLPAGFFGGVSERYQGSLAASYEVDVWGRLRSQSRAAALEAAAASENLLAIELSLAAQLADTWVALVAQREFETLLGAQLETAESFLELTRLRFSLGQTGAADVGRQRQNVESLNGQISVAAGQRAALEDQLAALLGVAPGNLAPSAHFRLPPAPSLPDPGIPAGLAELRPDVRAARLALAAADERLAAATAARLPSLSLGANLVSVEDMLEDLFGETFWQVGADLTVNLFDYGQRRSEIDLRTGEAEEALARYAQTLLEAWTEVSSTLALAEARDELATSLVAQLEEADRVLLLTRGAYREGQVGFLDVLLALRSQQELEQRLVEARRDQYASRIQLCRALGVSLAAGAEG